MAAERDIGGQHNTAGPGSYQFISQHGDVNVNITTSPPAFRLEPLSPSPTVDRDRLVSQPSMLLDARSRIVPFTGRDRELAALAAWRDGGDDAVSAVLLHGPGGQGKSRLATRFAELSATAGWDVVEARHSAAHGGPGDAWEKACARGLLVVVDYADRWAHSELVELFSARLVVDAAVRVLLIGRTVQWWAALRGELREIGATVNDLLLGEFAQGTDDREQVFFAARDRFGAVLGVPEPIAVPAPDVRGSGYGQVLTLHMAALVAALTVRFPGESMPDSVEGIAAYLLDRERMGWRRLYGTRLHGEEFDTSPTVMARAVFAAVLGGAATHAEAVARLDRLRIGPAERVLIDHRSCYPPRDRATVLEPLYPDRLAEDFVALLLPGHDITGYDPDPWTADVPRVLMGFDTAEGGEPLTRTVTVLASAADRWPHVAARLGALLTERPDLAVRAGGGALVALGAARNIDVDVLLAVEPHFPTYSEVDLDVGMAEVTARIVRDRVDDKTRLRDATSWHARLSARLVRAGRQEEALQVGHLTLAGTDRLSELDSDANDIEVAGYLLEVGTHLSNLGRHREAVDHTADAVELFRAAGHMPKLAVVLSVYGSHLQAIGQRDRAIDAARESVLILRALDALSGVERADPAIFAFTLLGLGTRLIGMDGDGAESTTVLTECVNLCRTLVDNNPQAHRYDLALALTNLGLALSVLGGADDEALRCAEEAVTLQRELVEVNPAAYRASLTASLVGCASRLAQVGRDEEAADMAAEAVTAARRLVEIDRTAHEATLADALAVHGTVIADLDRDRAGKALREAIELYERLRPVNDDYQRLSEVAARKLAALTGRRQEKTDSTLVDLFNEGVRLTRADQPDEAERRFREAAQAGMQQAMVAIGHLYCDQGRVADATSWLTRAANAGSTEGHHALGVLHREQGNQRKAKKSFRRAAKAGGTSAMTTLGELLRSEGKLRDAQRWFTAAAQAGDSDGDHRLGLLLVQQGRDDDAVVHLERAAEAGHRDAARALGDCLMRHTRVAEAEYWWRIAGAGERREQELPFTLDPGIEFAAVMLSEAAQHMIKEDRMDDALAAYQENIKSNERMLAANPHGTRRMSDATVYTITRRLAMTTADMAYLEHCMGGHHAEAIAHSAEAMATLGALAARLGDTLTHAYAQHIFAVVRHESGVDTRQALTAITEAVTVFTREAATNPEDHRERLGQALALRDLLSASLTTTTRHEPGRTTI